MQSLKTERPLSKASWAGLLSPVGRRCGQLFDKKRSGSQPRRKVAAKESESRRRKRRMKLSQQWNNKGSRRGK